ncbi:SusF/SusE family outer membrane protein [Pontibacter sp. 172403-2]|uniref:SusF/SusE family outer membrane protein n=1 Tax=Pontibacter rufus TaxID=2791028 RepID=UPI0018AFFF6C|nr:SusF/SusE family outer membrane protein [Pontibacter sp. 172403-2]MBF9253713.1 SusF/SusE family outer membrane protein [Pontibacter sp. 172403-2]
MRIFTLKLTLLLSFLLMATLGMAQDIFPTVGIIGTATTKGWDASTPMKLANAGDLHQWTLTLQLTQGEAKFRANDSWDVNWGGSEFPSGTASRNGANLQVPATSYYTVTFNDVTGAYRFEAFNPAVYATVGLIGDALPSGWGASVAMVKDAADPHRWTLENVSLSQGEVKFRANDNWAVSWGGSSFPAGAAIQNGPNIAVKAGSYTVTFNDVTGEYLFQDLNPVVYQTIGIIGTATSRGWDASTPMTLVAAGDPNNWVLTTFLQAGELKFRANDSWEVSWGGSGFPGGTGTSSGSNIQVTESGYYTIRFNDLTAAYYFAKLNPVAYESVGIVGAATAGGWDASTPMVKGADGHTWTLANASLTSGGAKFRVNNSWDVNWGGTTFPAGVAVQNGPDIPVAGGTYTITFNDVTREYGFDVLSGTTDGIVVLSPALPTADEPVTIIYDAGKGVSGLQGAGKVYLHSGVVLSGFDGTTWSNVVGNWGQDDGVGEMSPVAGEPNKWQITLPSISAYYHVPDGAPVFRLGMVFRNADGTQIGKSATNGDIFINVDPGDFVRFTAPATAEVFGVTGQQLALRAEASSVADALSLEINEGSGYQTVAQASNSQTLSYSYTYGTATSLQMRVTARIGDKTIISEKSISIHVRKPNTIAALPAGMRSGINYNPGDPGKATLVLLAPHKEFVYVAGDFNNWQISDAYQMNQTPDGEYFWLELNNLQAQKEYVYQYWVEGTVKIGDPYADKVADPFNDGNIPASVYPNPVAYSRTQDGIATVLQTGQQAYQWKFPKVTGGRPAKEDLVIYELLVRDFLASHSYQDLADTLTYLKRLGVNAIELMPVMEYEGNESWGYNPSYLFAPDKYYGTKNDLKAFIDKAHEEGFVVLLDMVLNHQFGQSPMVRMYFDEANARPSAESPWFNQEPTHPYNVGYDFNHESPYTQRYVDDVNRYWIEEYKFDGYRFDLTKGFTQKNNPNDVGAWSAYDQSRINILERMADKIWETDDSAYITMEHLAANDEEKVLANYGIMLWGNMNHPYTDVINGNTGTDLNWALSSTRGWGQKNLVAYMESHDEERVMVGALNNGGSSGDYNIRQLDTALERIKLASAFYFPLPGPKMIWEFGELGYDVPIEYNGRTGNKPVAWGGGDGLNYQADEAREKLYKAEAAIIKLVNAYSNVFEKGNFSWTPSGQFRRISVSHPEMNVTIIGNFGLSEGTMSPGFQHTGTWYDFFSGKAMEVASTASTTTLAPGEFHIFVDKPVAFPEPGLIHIYTPIVIVEPGNLTAQLEEPFSIKLKWVDKATGEQGYVVERKSEEQQAFEPLATLKENASEYVDALLVDGVSYQYRVKAISTVKSDSEWSDTASIDLPLLAPAGMAAVADLHAIALHWEDRSAHETAYVIEKATQYGNSLTPFSMIAELPADVTAFTDTLIRPGMLYHYRVVAKDADETSVYSNEASVRPADDPHNSLQDQLARSITIYPNPASGVLTISTDRPFSDPIKFQLVSMQGTVLRTSELTPGMLADVQIDVSKWQQGVYVLQVTYRDISIRQLLMVKH